MGEGDLGFKAACVRMDVTGGETSMARRKKYTPVTFSRAVDKYFKSISYESTVKHLNGEEILSRDGKPIRNVVFVIPPTLTGLCDALEISRDTFASYANNGDYADACNYAREVVEAYLERELLTRTKGIEGVKFNLQNNFGWSDKHEADDGAREITVRIKSDDAGFEE